MTGAGGAKEQVARMLALVPYLHSRGSVSLAEAARAFGVPAEQLVTDLKVLFMCGLPGGYPDDLIDVDIEALESEEGEIRSEGVIRVSNADYLTQPLRLTPTEASAMIVALRSLRAAAEPQTVEVVDRALTKLEAAAVAGPPVPVDVAPDERDDSATRDLVARLHDAVSRQVQVELDYYVPARDELSQRVVDPRGVTTHAGLTYLDAWCHSAQAPRLFRVDRVSAATVLETPVVSEATGPRDLSGGPFTGADDATRVTLLLGPEARWVVEYYPVEEVRPAAAAPGDEETAAGPGDVEVDLLVADERWLIRLLLRLAPHARVVSPATYGAGFTEATQQTLALYT